jgi:hypothetical protein
VEPCDSSEKDDERTELPSFKCEQKLRWAAVFSAATAATVAKSRRALVCERMRQPCVYVPVANEADDDKKQNKVKEAGRARTAYNNIIAI